jgi:hypothetical protein
MVSTIFFSPRACGLDAPCATVFALAPETRMGLLASGRFLSIFPTLSVRFFKVTIPIGTRGTASSTGKTLISGRVVGNLKTDVGKIERKRPDARRPIRVTGARANTVAHGASSPQARKASIAIVAIPPSGGGSTQGSLTRSASSIRRRRAHGSLHAIATGKSRPHSPGRRSPCPRSTSRGIATASCYPQAWDQLIANLNHFVSGLRKVQMLPGCGH